MNHDQRKNCECWVEALRSGNYAQANGRLRLGNRFCCLGVACDISGLSNWKQWKDLGYTYLDYSSRLPCKVAKYFGINNEEILLRLITLNDGGSTFYEIADYIEKEIL